MSDGARRSLSNLRDALMKERDATTDETKKAAIRAEIRRLGDEIQMIDFENSRAVATSLESATRGLEELIATARLDPTKGVVAKALDAITDAAATAADAAKVGFSPKAFMATEAGAPVAAPDFRMPDRPAEAASVGRAVPAADGGSRASDARPRTEGADSLPPIVKGRTLAELAADYRACWSACLINAAKAAEVSRGVGLMLSGKNRYVAVSTRCNDVPWQLIGIMHGLECGYRFERHLHNGDPLTAATVRVPANRPSGWRGGSWEDSAVDAVELKKLHKVERWTIAEVLYAFESFNGFGYRPLGIRSPYLWSFSNLYEKGKFVRDHEFDPTVASKQVGAAVILKALEKQGLWP